MESDEEVKENKSLKNKTGENHIKIDSEPNEVQFSDYGAGLSNAANLGRRHYEVNYFKSLKIIYLCH